MVNLVEQYAKYIRNEELNEGVFGVKMPHSVFREHVYELAQKHNLNVHEKSSYNDTDGTSEYHLTGHKLGSNKLRLEYTPDRKLSGDLAVSGSFTKSKLNVSLLKQTSKNTKRLIDTTTKIKNHKHMKNVVGELDNFISDFGQTQPIPDNTTEKK